MLYVSVLQEPHLPILVVRELDPMHSEVNSMYLLLALKFLRYIYIYIYIYEQHNLIKLLSPHSSLPNHFGVLKHRDMDFPGGAVVKNPPANAGDNGFESWSGKIPRVSEQLSLCATTTESEL